MKPILRGLLFSFVLFAATPAFALPIIGGPGGGGPVGPQMFSLWDWLFGNSPDTGILGPIGPIGPPK